MRYDLGLSLGSNRRPSWGYGRRRVGSVEDDVVLSWKPLTRIPGAMVNCVLSEITSDNPGDEITAVIGVAIGEKLGCVVETAGINEDLDELIGKAENMVRYMMDKRGVEIKDLIIEYSTTKVKDIASAIVSVVYLNEDIMEG